jgi:molecular chaperone HtpG
MKELYSNSEKYAQEATKLPNFNKIALAGVKEKVAELLDLIGRNHEIFATYTKHDISHINAMLGLLDWIIPPLTQKEMTPVDWIMITMSIYLHDLGMLVTQEEFENRDKNPAFQKFRTDLENDPKGKDYLNRAMKMGLDEQEVFFFQEYIRENHAIRINEWITGKHSIYWGKLVNPIVKEVSKLMEPFPSRFCIDLALVCESHHRSDLNKLEYYPLCQPYGNDPNEMANVQYAAIILRTVDLIHITKDRTPSVMYKTIKFSDPKGVKEWEKQKDTFAVRFAGRKFDPNDEETHIISVSADFKEERPFFALTEYLAWADGEIKQNKRWADVSLNYKDAKNFLYPWHSVHGDLRVEGNQPHQMRFEFDRGRLLDLLVGQFIMMQL